MATTADSPTDHRSPQTNISEQFTLYGFSQTDLYNLSLSSSSAIHRLREASVAPKIDRSVFNESAGSRRQTYARLRLLPRNKQPSSKASASSKASRIPPRTLETVDEENSQIIAILQGLFGVESLRNANANANANRVGGEDEDGLVPVQVEFNLSLPESSAAEFQRIPIDVVDTGQKKRKRGRPRKNENYGIIITEEEPKKVDAAAIPPPPPAPVIVNEKGFAVDVVGLGEVGDPFGEEVKRRTQGLETQEQLLEFLEGLNGEWGSQRKKRRIVPASDLGDLLPAGWKIVLSLQRRAGRASVICRRYVSPDGHQFESCKEVSAYLLSLFGVQDHLKSNYTDGSQHFSSNINNASGAGWFPTGDMKTDANASYLHLAGTSIHSLHVKQAIASSSIESEKLNSSDGNFNNDLNLDSKLGEITGSAFRDFEHQTEDKFLPLKADKNDAISVKGCSVDEDRVRNVCNEKLVGAIEASDAACNLYVPLDFATPFSNNNSGICQFSDEINDVTSIKIDMSNFASQDRNIGCYETVSTGNKQAHVDSNGHGLSVRLVEDHRQKIGFESSMLAPNPEGEIFAVNNLEDRHLISSLEDMENSDGKPVKDANQQIVSTRYQSENKDFSTIVKLHSAINITDRTQTSMLKDSAEGKYFDSDLPSPFIDDKTCVHSDYIHNVSVNTCSQDASESGGVVVASDLKVAEDVVTSCVQERSSSTDQNCKMDYLLHNMSTLDDNEHPSAFHNNVSNISAGTVDALKAVDAIVSCRDTVDAYTSASTMQGRSQGCMSVPLAGSILNRFYEQSDDSVNNAHKSCSPEKAKSEAEMFQTDSIDMPKFR